MNFKEWMKLNEKEDIFGKIKMPMPRVEEPESFLKQIWRTLFPPWDTMKGVDWKKDRPESIEKKRRKARHRR